MKVLVACEYSGTVRDAFIKQGHDAMSCDILASDTPGPHYKGNVLDVLDDGWDLMIAHPPCTYLCNSGVRWLHTTKERMGEMTIAALFFRTLLGSNIPKIAVENPIMHKYAKIIVGKKQDQIVQPWWFGHTEKKSLCLWLKNLPLLIPTNEVKEEMEKLPKKEQQKIHYAAPSKNRSKIRSLTYSGMAKAMAEQWGV
jgi:hypothetical protein